MGGVDKEYVEMILRDVEEAVRVVEEDAAKPFEALTRAEKNEMVQHCDNSRALSALAQHLARDAGARPQTPVQAVRELVNMGLATAEEAEESIRLIRLRNLIVHWTVDYQYENVKKTSQK
ncbi:MAG: DUF86 domain-containing protein [Pyrobaculum sp.]